MLLARTGALAIFARWPIFSTHRFRNQPTAIRPRTSRCSRGWSRCAAAPACTSAAPTSAALHHLAAEVLDNAMDEAVAGHARRIEIELAAGDGVTVRDNGRGIPVDPASEISRELGARSHPDDAAFRRQVLRRGLQDRPAACTASASRWSTRSPTRSRSRSPATAGCGARSYSRGQPRDDAQGMRARSTTGAAPRCAFIPTRRSSASSAFRPALLYRMARSKAYLFRGVEIRWRCDPSLPRPDDVPAEERLHFPGGLADFLARASMAGDADPAPFLGRGRAGRMAARSNGRSPGRRMRKRRSATPTATRCRRPRAARTKPACAPR